MKLPEVIVKYRHFLTACTDTIIISIFYYVICQIFNEQKNESIFVYYIIPWLLLLGLYLVSYKLSHLYSSLWRYANSTFFFRNILLSMLIGCVYTILIYMAFGIQSVTGNVILTILLSFSLVFYRLMYTEYCRLRRKQSHKNYQEIRMMVVGAGLAASSFINEMQKTPKSKYKLVCCVDDDRSKLNNYILDIKIEGTTEDIVRLAKAKRIQEIFICIPSIGKEEKARIVSKCLETSCLVKILPETYASLAYEVNLQQKFRKLDIHDVLGREEILFDHSSVRYLVKQKVVLITGGGSIGSELCRQVAAGQPSQLVILDINENNAYEIQQELLRSYGGRLSFVVEIASIRDCGKISKIFNYYKPDLVFHAAAHKHVPLMEHNPEEAVKNNIFGTYNVMMAAIENKTEKFILISTDKAVNPSNVMGATKRFTEMMIQSIGRNSDTEFAAVRFGNVLGSAGSVIPLFKKQIESGGPVTVTHQDITRYFMTIPEAVQLVLQAASMESSGQIYVLDMGEPVRILELAVKMIELMGYSPYEEIPVVISGLRPGEKLYEELLMDEEGVEATENNQIFIGHPLDISVREMKEKLMRLENVLDGKNEEQIITVLSEVVPTYVPDERRSDTGDHRIGRALA